VLEFRLLNRGGHSHRHGQFTGGFSTKDSPGRRHVSIVTADSGAYVALARQQAVGGIEPNPTQPSGGRKASTPAWVASTTERSCRNHQTMDLQPASSGLSIVRINKIADGSSRGGPRLGSVFSSVTSFAKCPQSLPALGQRLALEKSATANTAPLRSAAPAPMLSISGSRRLAR